MSKLRHQIAQLYAIAGRLARKENMPSRFRDDWNDLPSNLSQKAWKEIHTAALKAEEQCNQLSIDLMKVIKDLTDGDAE